MNRNQFEIDTETRRIEIITYVINHQGCTRADLERGLEGRISKKTIDKLVDIMIKERILKQHRDNKKSRKLYVSKSNLLGSVPIELEQFKSALILLFDKTTEKIIVPVFKASVFKDEDFDTSNDITTDRISQLSEERLSLFFRMVDSILLRSIIKWPKVIQDKETLKKLYHTVFTKIGDMLIDIAEHHEIPRFAMDYSIEKLAIQRLRGGGSLFEHWRYFKNCGIQQEVEKVIDALWSIDKEIQEIIYKDLEIVSTKVGVDFKYQSDDWRKLFHAVDSLDSPNVL